MMIDENSITSPLRAFMSAFFPGIEPLFELMDRFSKPEVASAISAAFADFERRMREEEQAFLDFVVQNGWVGLERHFTSEQLRLLIQIRVEQGIDAANDRIPDFFSTKQVKEMVGAWRAIPYFERRPQLCADIVEAYRIGQHTLLIPALLPLAEGLSAEIVGGSPNATDKVMRAAKAQQHHPSSDTEFSTATVTILDKFYRRTHFGQGVAPALFNRHRILHGRSADYATPCNSLRAFLLVDTVADIWHRLKST